MKRQLEIGLSISVLVTVLIIGVLTLVFYIRHRTLDPTPNSESAFLASYDPRHVVEASATHHMILTYGQSSSPTGGHGFITHKHSLEPSFTIGTENRIRVMNALSDDAYTQLLLNGAFVTSRTGEPTKGYRFEDLVGTSVGTVIVSPLALDTGIHRNTPLCADLEDMGLTVTITEKWFPKESEAMEERIKSTASP